MTRRKDPTEIRIPVAPEDLPAFEPVSRKAQRHDGWTPERQRAFIGALADTGSVSRACRHVNMSTNGAYWLRRQPRSEGFRRAWEAALDLGVQRLKDVAYERAIDGQLVPVFVAGKLKGFRRVRNDRLLMFCLRMNMRGEDGKRLAASYFDPNAARLSGSVSAWMGNGAVMPPAVSTLTRRGGTPRSAKVVEAGLDTEVIKKSRFPCNAVPRARFTAGGRDCRTPGPVQTRPPGGGGQ